MAILLFKRRPSPQISVHLPCLMFRRSLFAAAALLLIAAVALAIYGSTRPHEQNLHGRLVDLIPEAPPGWTRTLRPIAESPEMQKKTAELLNFDDGVFVDYTRGADRLSVYVAYWTPGRMSHRLVASHTPDVCWVGSGWQCTARGTALPQVSDPFHQVFPAESRTFTVRGISEYVWFWHLVGGKPESYATTAEPPWYASLSDILAKGLRQREEQYFIRLSSMQPLDSPTLAAVLEPVLRALPLHTHRT